MSNTTNLATRPIIKAPAKRYCLVVNDGASIESKNGDTVDELIALYEKEHAGSRATISSNASGSVVKVCRGGGSNTWTNFQ